MTETELRVQLAKKLGYQVLYPSLPASRDKQLMFRKDRSDWCILSLYDLCLEGEELLTEQQQDWYIGHLFEGCDNDTMSNQERFTVIRLSNLPERATALCEVLP